MGLDHLVPHLDRHLRQGDRLEQAGIVDENIDGAEPLDGRVDHVLDGVLVADIGLDGDRLAAFCLNLLHHRLGRLASLT